MSVAFVDTPPQALWSDLKSSLEELQLHATSKANSDGARNTSWGKEFHRRRIATEKAQLLTSARQTSLDGGTERTACPVKPSTLEGWY